MEEEVLELPQVEENEEADELLPEVEAASFSSQQDGFDLFQRRINKYPILTVEEEYDCVTRWQLTRDSRALDKLVNSHLRLVIRIAAGYKGYGLPLPDMVSEGSVGIMQAVDRFDISRGFRFSTYASWWIHSAMKEYVLRNWSMVRLGSTGNQKKLFFQLRRLKQQMRNIEDNQIPDDFINQISEELEIPKKEVMDMNFRLLGPDFSLNAPLADEEGGGEWMDVLEDESDNQEASMIGRDERVKRLELLRYALDSLNEREYKIVASRQLTDNPITLAEMATEMGISRERVRQIEATAMSKLATLVTRRAAEQRMVRY